jgi:hypothetical protein
MKRLVIAIATVIAAAAMVSTATATDTFYETEGFFCGILTPDGFVVTQDSSFVIYASGKAVLKCHAQTDYSGPRVVLSPKNTGVDCGYFDDNVGVIDLPFWKSTHGSNGQVVLTCNGQVDLNDRPSPDVLRSAGGTTGN